MLLDIRVKKYHSKSGQYLVDWVESVKKEKKMMNDIKKEHKRKMESGKYIEIMDGIYAEPLGRPQSVQASLDRINELYGVEE